MEKTVLILGGAGFIGSHTADKLFEKGYHIKIFDNLSPKSHFGKWPDYLNPGFEKIQGDVRDKDAVLKSLQGVDYVIHLAALMDLTPNYSEFCDVNITSTGLLYELIVTHKLPIRKVVVASSQFVYGEGRWKCIKDGEVFPKVRTNSQLMNKKWDPVCPVCGGEIENLTNLESHQDPPNQYAISKYSEELLSLKLGRLNDIPSVALRYSIVHGPRQSLKSAYSGALRIFTMQLLAVQKPSIYEDGMSKRDFVSVHDVAEANIKVLEDERANYENFNIGGGKAYTVLGLANMIADQMGMEINFVPTHQFRVGDIRHAVSDITKLKGLGWEPKISEEDVIKEYLDWIRTQVIDQTFLTQATNFLQKSGIVRETV